MNKLASTLKNCILFSLLEQDAIENYIIPAGRLVDHPQNASLIMSHDTIDHLDIILQGRVQISQIHPDGQRNLMDIMDTLSVVGADLICTKTRISPYDAIADDNTQTFRLPISCLTSGELPPDIESKIMQMLLYLVSRENLRKHYRIAILTQKSLRSRIMTYLNMQSSRLEKTTFNIPFNREELADYLCVNRSALSHELKKMEHEGLIKTRKSTFTLLQSFSTTLN